MNRRACISIIIAALLFITSCSYSRNKSDTENQSPKEREEIQEETSEGQKQYRDNLAKSDKEFVEENINGISMENDMRLTEKAFRLKVAQMNIGINQRDAVQINELSGESPENDVLHEYNTKLPDEFINGIAYNRYNLSYDYFLVTSENEEMIHKNPDPSDAVVCKAYNGEKLALHQKVTGKAVGDSDIWYKVSCMEGDQVKTGYIHSSTGQTRTFQFDKMLSQLKYIQDQIRQGKLSHISNYKNANGAPPSKDGAATDEYGMRIYQSAPGYEKANTDSNFRCIPDGMLVRVLDEDGDFYYVHVLTFDKKLYVPKKYIDTESDLSEITHAAIVDRNQQNQALFRLTGNTIEIKSYTLATTGLKGELSFETPLGYYKAIEKKDRFEYLKDGSDEVAGYAPYATRFCGGAYIHGVPVNYEEKDGERVDPGIKEYLHTIGTFPRSHMCVRNFSSHAEYLYNWMDTNRGVVIVIE